MSHASYGRRGGESAQMVSRVAALNWQRPTGTEVVDALFGFAILWVPDKEGQISPGLLQMIQPSWMEPAGRIVRSHHQLPPFRTSVQV